jgi:hypothetical protein
MKKYAAIFILILSIWCISPLILTQFIFPILRINNLNISGIYTAVAALFSALAFSALIVTLWLQNKQLQLQKLELESAENINKKNIEISAYSALLTYYNSGYSYDKDTCELSPQDIAKKLSVLVNFKPKKT